MRFSCKPRPTFTELKTFWRPFFPLWPRRTKDGVCVWLEPCERRLIAAVYTNDNDIHCFWEYRLKEKPPRGGYTRGIG